MAAIHACQVSRSLLTWSVPKVEEQAGEVLPLNALLNFQPLQAGIGDAVSARASLSQSKTTLSKKPAHQARPQGAARAVMPCDHYAAPSPVNNVQSVYQAMLSHDILSRTLNHVDCCAVADAGHHAVRDRALSYLVSAQLHPWAFGYLNADDERMHAYGGPTCHLFQPQSHVD